MKKVMREIIEDAAYQKQMERLGTEWRRLDDAMCSSSVALQSSAELFPIVPGTKLRRLKLVGFEGVPPVSIFFSLTPNQVILRSAALIDEEQF